MTDLERKKNVESAMKSLELEGFVYTEYEKKVFNQVATGEITLSEAKKSFLSDL